MSETTTVIVSPEADDAFDEAIERMKACNPQLFTDLKLRIPQPMFREIVRTFFYLGFEAGEANALSKIKQ